MSDIPFGRLGNLRRTEAWAKDARNSTPWLAAKIGHLTDVITVPPELIPMEVAEDSRDGDSPVLPDLLGQIPPGQEIGTVTALMM